MATKRDFDTEDGYQSKRVKVENGNGNSEPETNPYLAHWNDDAPSKSKFPMSPHVCFCADLDPDGSGIPLNAFKRHATTDKQARAAEDGPLNPFTGKPLSKKYMSILEKRRELPVHTQRYVVPQSPRNTEDLARMLF